MADPAEIWLSNDFGVSYSLNETLETGSNFPFVLPSLTGKIFCFYIVDSDLKMIYSLDQGTTWKDAVVLSEDVDDGCIGAVETIVPPMKLTVVYWKDDTSYQITSLDNGTTWGTEEEVPIS